MTSLLPDRHPTGDFFVCDVLAGLPKDDLASMEHPIFSLATRPDRQILEYEHKGTRVSVVPSVKGRATIHDKDILIYCVSQLMAALNAGRPVSRALHLTAHDLLVATNRETSGDGYRRLCEAFERLAGTRITTNIVTGPKEAAVETTTGFGLIEAWEVMRRAPGRGKAGGRMISVRVLLSEWLYQAVLGRSVLTLSRDYFRIRRPLERRIYEIARKHCGRQTEWVCGLETLHKKSGSTSPRRVFRAKMREIARRNVLPDYEIIEGVDDLYHVRPKVSEVVEHGAAPQISEMGLEAARDVALGWDVYALEAEWRSYWHRRGARPLSAPDKAFLGWVKKRITGNQSS